MIEIPTWKVSPKGIYEHVQEKFHTGGLTVAKTDLIYSGVDRYKLRTQTSGTVQARLMLVFKHFGKYGVEFK